MILPFNLNCSWDTVDYWYSKVIGTDKTITNTGMHFKCETPVWFQDHMKHQYKMSPKGMQVHSQ